MKILFSADWHIKLGQKNVPVEWQKQRYLLMFQKLNNIECDLQIVGGDIFDRIPTLEEQELFWEFVSGCKVETLVYPGNHEAVGKYTTFLTILKKTVAKINPKVRIVDDIEETENYVIIPYNKLKLWATAPQDYVFEAPICFTHVRGDIPPHVTAEVNLDLFENFNIVFAGDLHSHSNSQRNIIYPGSPLTTTFHRNIVSNGVVLVDTENQEWKWIDLELPQLIKLSVTDQSEMVKTDYHHTMYELHGDMVDLAAVENQELLDKKVIKTTTETSLILSKDMTIEDELSEYLLYIMGLEESQVKKLLGIFHDSIKNTTVE